MRGVGVALALVGLSCGGRSGLAELTADVPDATQPVVAADAATTTDGGDAAPPKLDAEPGADAADANDGSCATTFLIKHCTIDGVPNEDCCAFSIGWTCDGRTVRIGAGCPWQPPGAPDAGNVGPVTYSGTCEVDGQPAGTFTVTLPECTCAPANGAILGEAEAQCGISP